MGDFYRRPLPHYQPQDGIFSVNFRLVDSLPQSVIDALLTERRKKERWLQGLRDGRKKQARYSLLHADFASRFDEALHNTEAGNRWLERKDVAQLVSEALIYADAKWCTVLASSIMTNHVHGLIGVGNWPSSIESDGEGCPPKRETADQEFPLTYVLASIKKFTSRRANQILGRRGPFWQEENYDHLIRSGDDLARAAWYILMNPVKAGLCQDWQEWPWTYCSQWLRERL